MSEQQTDQSLPGALEQRAASLLQAFDAQGNHRTGTAVDNASAEWLAGHVRQLGIEPSHETFTLSRVDPQLAYARLANRRIDGVPMFDATFTSAEGVSGRLGPLGSDADIGLAETSPVNVTHTAEADKCLLQSDSQDTQLRGRLDLDALRTPARSGLSA